VNSLALLLEAQGKLAEAEPLYRRALEGREQQLGAHHPSTLTSVNNLAMLLRTQGKLAEAELLYRRYASSREMAAARCLGCGTQHTSLHKLKKCSRCRVARFCSTECVARAGPAHKPNCKLWR
jgi:tetratricopeptide (TPR) repeat protein